ncbi:hypothetical protein BXZ70DRAFT_1009230 [Cristinia sonorae]|uniref:Ser-Thr-rich glycosyl-phosphatidyl-inositol-anchored membrane family-domain-containing protein n=1 Tax=Cristinia sonorae TaxID=1940300 RepID=A0A8K0XNY7_9AGAR|nr:hypothetical protein BXZ70DRAFT_1009230 [Cristinia sonorae]
MFKLLLTLFAASSVVLAGPITPVAFDVYNPKITSPVAAQVWPVGSAQVVSWDLHSIPPSEYEKVGHLLLGFNENDTENLDILHPLSTGFSIGDGNVTITVPDVPTRDDYIVVLLGDSGNVSPEFSIVPAAAPTTEDETFVR